jgi:glutathione S-transferase
VKVIELWHCPDARSFRVLWALEELGLGYRLHLLPFPPRVHAKDYLAINPLGTIPAFRDGETFMTESAAILQYLGVRYGPQFAVPPDDPNYGAWLNFLVFGEASLTFPQALVLRYRVFELGKAEVVADDYAKWFLGRLRWIDRALADGREHLVAGRFTFADVSVGYALLLAHQLRLNETFSPAIVGYWERLKARPGFQAAKAAQKLEGPDALPTPF